MYLNALKLLYTIFILHFLKWKLLYFEQQIAMDPISDISTLVYIKKIGSEQNVIPII